MGLNVKDIQLRLFKVVHDSTKSSYIFMQRHPLISGASLVCFILYAFLSYIYNFLVYMSHFLMCAIIFIKIFWSSEQTQLKYVKKKEECGGQKKVEPKCPKIPNNKRHELLYKYPSQNAASRRRNFSDKNWDVYGGLEEKAKDLSTVFHNEFTKRSIENRWATLFEKGESYLDNKLFAKKTQVPKRKSLRSEPSMVDLVECGDLEMEKKIEEGDDDDREEEQENRNNAIEWTEDDKKNLMYLGISEMERNRRLESLIARRKANKLVKGELENSLIDKKLIASVLTKTKNPIDSSKDFDDGIEMPGSAPSFMPRSPYDILYDHSKEKPNLTRDSSLQELSSKKDMSFCRHESFTVSSFEINQEHEAKEHDSFNKRRKYPDKVAYSRFRRHCADKGTHDWLIDQLIYNECGENVLQIVNPLTKKNESTHEEIEKCKIDISNTKDEKMENDHETKSMSNQISEPSSEKLGSGPRFPRPHERLLTFPISTTTNTNINDALYHTVTSVVGKRQESIFLTNGRLCHTPTHSVASDLQVEVSEVSSPTSTVGENVETNSSMDRDSILYDGDIDRDISSGSEELWEASFHGEKEAQGVKIGGDNVEVNNNSKGLLSPLAPQHIDEENAANVNLFSLKFDLPEDTQTHTINSEHNIFGYVKHPIGETEAQQSFNSSHALDQNPNETYLEKPEELYMSENVTNDVHDMNNLTSIDQDNMENLINNEDPSTSVMRQESIDETSTYSVSSSPRSVLPEKVMEDEISLSAFDINIHIGVQQSNMEGMTQETLDNDMLQTIQPIMNDTTDESHNVDFNNSQEQPNLQESSIEESNVFGSMDDEDVYNREEHDKSKNDDINEDNSCHLHRQEAMTESTTLTSEITTSEDMDNNSRDLVDDKVSFDYSKLIY
ncbi:hypothetical protein VNO78_27842 [Psophocarpus tetragonolobus]|uniref:Uncharacterized protein n=1 Tax=Psophocarpus tetragonolobus TaxID=3891 RepID=A0AAN9XB03_PSOTE